MEWAEAALESSGSARTGAPPREYCEYSICPLCSRATQRIATSGVAASICNDHSSMVARLA